METFKDVLLITLLIPPVIFIVLTAHELGHYWAARIFNVRIGRFVIGFGRRVWSRVDKRGVEWVIKSIPVSGHVHLAGKDEKDLKYIDGRLFADSPLHVQMMVVAAGPAINVMLPFLLFFLALSITGLPVVPPVINGIEINEVAYKAGIVPGDKIVAVNGEPISAYHQVKAVTKPLPPKPVSLQIEREGEVLPFIVTPSVIDYLNDRGLEKRHGRLGVMVRHLPYKLKAIEMGDGMDVVDKPDLARELLLDRLGERVALGMNSVDGERHYYLVDLHEASNAHLRDPSHEDYNSFHTGRLKDNVYLRLSPSEILQETTRQSLRVIGNVLQIPFQVFPVDSEELAPQALVSTDTSLSKYMTFRFFYMASLISVFIAMINLIPLPGLDGSKLMLGIVEAAAGKRTAEKHRAAILFWTLASLYLTVLVVNIPDLSVYLGKKAEQAGEFIGDINDP